MNTEENPDEQKGTPSPYQNADADVEITEVHYYSPAKRKGVYLGKTIRKITPDGKLSYTLVDPTDRILGPDVHDEGTARSIWGTIAEALEHRSQELGKLRKDDGKEQDKGKER